MSSTVFDLFFKVDTPESHLGDEFSKKVVELVLDLTRPDGLCVAYVPAYYKLTFPRSQRRDAALMRLARAQIDGLILLDGSKDWAEIEQHRRLEKHKMRGKTDEVKPGADKSFIEDEALFSGVPFELNNSKLIMLRLLQNMLHCESIERLQPRYGGWWENHLAPCGIFNSLDGIFNSLDVTMITSGQVEFVDHFCDRLDHFIKDYKLDTYIKQKGQISSDLCAPLKRLLLGENLTREIILSTSDEVFQNCLSEAFDFVEKRRILSLKNKVTPEKTREIAEEFVQELALDPRGINEVQWKELTNWIENAFSEFSLSYALEWIRARSKGTKWKEISEVPLISYLIAIDRVLVQALYN